jgi:uncharacterized protein YvpB
MRRYKMILEVSNEITLKGIVEKKEPIYITSTETEELLESVRFGNKRR